MDVYELLIETFATSAIGVGRLNSITRNPITSSNTKHVPQQNNARMKQHHNGRISIASIMMEDTNNARISSRRSGGIGMGGGCGFRIR